MWEGRQGSVLLLLRQGFFLIPLALTMPNINKKFTFFFRYFYIHKSLYFLFETFHSSCGWLVKLDSVHPTLLRIRVILLYTQRDFCFCSIINDFNCIWMQLMADMTSIRLRLEKPTFRIFCPRYFSSILLYHTTPYY